AELFVGCAFGMWHHAENIALCVTDAGNIICGPVWIVYRTGFTVFIAVPEQYLIVLIQQRKCGIVGIIFALAMSDRDFKCFFLRHLYGEACIVVFCSQKHIPAGKLPAVVMQKCAREQSRFT